MRTRRSISALLSFFLAGPVFAQTTLEEAADHKAPTSETTESLPTAVPAEQSRSDEELRAEIEELRRRVVDVESSMASMAESQAQAEIKPTPSASIYGFFDVNFQRLWVPDEILGSALVSNPPSFLFGNLNTYLDFHPLPAWRFLTEVRFLLNPLGDVESRENATLGTTFERTDVTTLDRSNFFGDV